MQSYISNKYPTIEVIDAKPVHQTAGLPINKTVDLTSFDMFEAKSHIGTYECVILNGFTRKGQLNQGEER
jgi:hypothetical protein